MDRATKHDGGQRRRTFSGARVNGTAAFVVLAFLLLQGAFIYFLLVTCLAGLMDLVSGHAFEFKWFARAYFAWQGIQVVRWSWRQYRDKIFLKDVGRRYAAMAAGGAVRLATFRVKDGAEIVVETGAADATADGGLSLAATYRREAVGARRFPCRATVDGYGRIVVRLASGGKERLYEGASLFDPEGLRTLTLGDADAGPAGPAATVAGRFRLRERKEDAARTLRVRPASTPDEVEAEAILSARADNSDAELTKARRKVALRFHPDRVPVEARAAAASTMAWANTRIDEIEQGLAN